VKTRQILNPVSLHVTLDGALDDLAKRMAKRDDRSVASLIRHLIRQEAQRIGLAPDRRLELVNPGPASASK